MNNKILVAYFTKGGASEEYAKIIVETLTAKGIDQTAKHFLSLD